jgi:hypothetical protein
MALVLCGDVVVLLRPPPAALLEPSTAAEDAKIRLCFNWAIYMLQYSTACRQGFELKHVTLAFDTLPFLGANTGF